MNVIFFGGCLMYKCMNLSETLIKIMQVKIQRQFRLQGRTCPCASVPLEFSCSSVSVLIHLLLLLFVFKLREWKLKIMDFV